MIKYAWFYKLMCNAAFQWLPRKLSCRFKKRPSYCTNTRKLVHIPCCLHQRSTASLGLMVTFWVMFEKQIHHLNVACFAGNIYFNVWRVVNLCTLNKIMPDCSLRKHLATTPLVSPPNEIWESSVEIPYWWCITTQIWVVLLIGRAA